MKHNCYASASQDNHPHCSLVTGSLINVRPFQVPTIGLVIRPVHTCDWSDKSNVKSKSNSCSITPVTVVGCSQQNFCHCDKNDFSDATRAMLHDQSNSINIAFASLVASVNGPIHVPCAKFSGVLHIKRRHTNSCIHLKSYRQLLKGSIELTLTEKQASLVKFKTCGEVLSLFQLLVVNFTKQGPGGCNRCAT